MGGLQGYLGPFWGHLGAALGQDAPEQRQDALRGPLSTITEGKTDTDDADDVDHFLRLAYTKRIFLKNSVFSFCCVFLSCVDTCFWFLW